MDNFGNSRLRVVVVRDCDAECPWEVLPPAFMLDADVTLVTLLASVSRVLRPLLPSFLDETPP